MSYRLNILGEPRIVDSEGSPVDFPRGKPLALLSYVAVEGRPVPRTELGELFWPDAPQNRTRHSVRQAIWLIRRTLGEDVLWGDDPVSVSGEALSCDLVEFEGALEVGRVDHARALWRGRLLSRMSLTGCRGWDRWLEEARSRVERNLFQALLSQVQRAPPGTPREQTLEYLDEALALNPFSVDAQRLRIDTLLEMGETSRARRALEESLRELGDDDRIKEELALLRDKIDHLETRVESPGVERLGESVEFVGRAGELADLRGAWKRARTGYSTAACVLGPTGIGKTRLAAELLTAVERQGDVVARAKGFRGEHRIPWGSVADLIQELMALPGAKGISSGSDAVLRGVLPSLSNNGRELSSQDEPREVHPAALADAVADLVEAVGFETPLAVFVDDWQWVDKESRALLGKVFRRVRGLPCLFLIAERAGERRLRQEGAESLVGDLGGRRIVLAPLDLAELDELLALLAEFEDPTETKALVSRLHRITGGNPLFVGEVLRKLAEDGFYEQVDGRWIIRAGKLDENLGLPESVQSLIRERLERLSPAAGQVASALARERRMIPAPILRRRAGLDEAVFTRAMGELLDREVVEWVGSTELDFTHDQLREAVGVSFSAPKATGLIGWIRRHRFVTAIAATAVLALASWGGVQVLRFRQSGTWAFGSAPDPTYPFGKGRVILRGDTLVEAIPPAQDGGEWTLQASGIQKPSLPAARIFGPFKTPSGRIRWLGNEITSPEAAPRTVEFHHDGTSSVYVETSGDDGFKDLAPSGDVGLVMLEDSLSTTYRQNLVRVDEPEMERTLLYRPAEMLFGSDWSPDGQRIATVLMGDPDTLLVLTPIGTEVARYSFPDFRFIHNPVWCADSRHIAFIATEGGPDHAFLLDTEDGSFREIGEELISVSWPLCLGNGEGAIFHGINEEGAWVFFQDLQEGSLRPLLRTTPGEVWRSIWFPDETPAPVWEIDIIGGERSVDWGSSLTLEVRGIRTDGTPGPTALDWTSSNPGVASVSPGGTVTGNRAGRAVITATHAGWVTDSVLVTVREVLENPGEVIFRETFEGDGLDDWVVSDSTFPVPAVLERDGETLLSLRGEGRYRDPIYTREQFSLQLGVTLELEFLMPLTRNDRQRVYVCLKGRVAQADSMTQEAGQYDREFCFQYPSTELSKRKPDVFRVSAGVGYFAYEESAAPELPSNDWTHLALQVRSDGTYKIFVNRSEVFEFQNPWGIDPNLEWRIELAGASLDTELLIRNLTLWRGERFGVDAPNPTEASGGRGEASPASGGGPSPSEPRLTEPTPRSRR
jgi:DNA-binding SARP family transcriptional activator